MPPFTLEFGASSGASEGERHTLDAETLEAAKAEAAMLYAGASFRRSPPSSYRIVSRGKELYRFPEAG